uniref:Uncharacterized protein n=1 Tax=Ditylenchus dipsaci TaxID=166011 RepID=A0A915DMH8_9BILA
MTRCHFTAERLCISACQNVPYSIVEAELSSRFVVCVHGRKKEVLSRLNDRIVLSFTSDIWSGPTEVSSVSLIAHGNDTVWKRHKLVLCVRHFPVCHNFKTMSQTMDNMLRGWESMEIKEIP